MKPTHPYPSPEGTGQSSPPRRGPDGAPLLGGDPTELPSWEGTRQSSPPGRGRGGFRVSLRARSLGWSLPARNEVLDCPHSEMRP